MAQKLEIVINAQDAASGVLRGVSGALGGIKSPLGSIGTIAGGILAAGIFTNLAGQIRGMSSAILDTIGKTQMLELGLQGILTENLMYTKVNESKQVYVQLTEEEKNKLAETRQRRAELNQSLREQEYMLGQISQTQRAGDVDYDRYQIKVNGLRLDISKLDSQIAQLTNRDGRLVTVLSQVMRQTMDYAAAYALAGTKVDELIAFTEKLAIQSPFETDQVQEVVRLGLAANMTAESVQGFTKAFLDYAATRGIGAENLAFAADQFLQLQKTGKVTEIDLRQLRRLGIDVSKVLGVEMGMSVEQFNAKLEQSPELMEKLFSSFTTYAGKVSGGALQKFATSVPGIMSTASDAMKVGAKYLFRPLVDAATPLALDLVGKLTEFATGPGAKAVGQRLAASISTGMAMMGGIAVAFQTGGIKGGIGAMLSGLLGTGMIDAAQAGMVAGFVDRITQTLDTLSAWWNTNGPGLISTAKGLWASFASKESAFAEMLLKNFYRALDKIGAWLTANGPAIQVAFANISNVIAISMGMTLQVLGAVQPLLDGIINAVLGIGTVIIKVLAGDWDGAWAAAGQVVNDLVTGIMATLENLVTLMWNWIVEAWPKIQVLWTGLWNGIGETAQKIPGLLTEVLTKGYAALTGWLKENGPKLLSIGNNVVQGLIDGIMEGARNLADIAGKLINMLVEAVKDKLKLWSPSRVMMEIGRQITAGLALGIADSAMLPARALGNVGLSLRGVAGPSLSYAMAGNSAPAGGAGAVTVVYSPVFSLADANEFETRLAPMIRRAVREARESK